jgi:hypothetical protein
VLELILTVEKATISTAARDAEWGAVPPGQE